MSQPETKPEETFELRVEFAGLCLYVDPRFGSKGPNSPVTIVMPDARRTVNPVHADGARGDPHVGYVRFDLANVIAALTDGKQSTFTATPGTVDSGTGSPPNEIIHRFDFEELDFGLRDPDKESPTLPVTGDIKVPKFDQFADDLSPIEAIFGNGQKGPYPFIMRTTIEGGTISAQPSGKTWGFSPVLKNKRNGAYSDNFAGFVVWTRQVPMSILDKGPIVVRLKKLDGSGETAIPLKPVDMVGSDRTKKKRITLKVANLCANNPLEWDEFRLRNVVDRDIDFKWLYRLLKSDTDDLKTRLANGELPFPREVSIQAYGDEDCVGGSIKFPT